MRNNAHKNNRELVYNSILGQILWSLSAEVTDVRSFIKRKIMAIIVDKIQKRKNIAISCIDLLLEKGVKNIRISEIAEVAGIGKGTFYEYFKNKEGLAFEIIRVLVDMHHERMIVWCRHETTTKQKVLYLFDFFLSDDLIYKKHLELYKEYMSIVLASEVGFMPTFNNECTNFIIETLSEIVREGIEKEEIIESSLQLVDSMLAAERGFLLNSWAENISYKSKFKEFIDVIFNLVEIRK